MVNVDGPTFVFDGVTMGTIKGREIIWVAAQALQFAAAESIDMGLVEGMKKAQILNLLSHHFQEAYMSCNNQKLYPCSTY
jgi:hypothetical protein